MLQLIHLVIQSPSFIVTYLYAVPDVRSSYAAALCPRISIEAISSQVPPATEGVGPSGNGTGTVIGLAVAVVIILIVGSVIVAAVLITWRMKRISMKAFRSEHSDWVHVSVRMHAPCPHCTHVDALLR